MPNTTEGPSLERTVRIPAGNAVLPGDFAVPAAARGLVVFAHGSGSSRRSPRNRFVAEALQRRGLATLLFDLLTPEEDRIDQRTAELRFDIDLLARRLVAATDWVHGEPATRGLVLGYFGASTGAAAALVAATLRPKSAQAIVSRGGRPDLAMAALPQVRAPTLLIVGENDPEVIWLNRKAMKQTTAPTELHVVPGATHLFEEPGTLEEVARMAGEWFGKHLVIHG
jgi:putative phosphoribosyl transferase